MDVMAQARYLLSSRPRLLISLRESFTLGKGNQTSWILVSGDGNQKKKN
jgi:hypothetical protein